MTTDPQKFGDDSDEMAEYLQTFLDETEEQLDDLVETMLALEEDATDKDELNEAFRLIHSIKGSAGMMGFDSITMLTHHLENRFERFRSGAEEISEPTMNLVLRCVDFLRQCNNRLRDGEQLGSSSELLEELRLLEQSAEKPASDPSTLSTDRLPSQESERVDSKSPPPPHVPDSGDDVVRLFVRFRAGLHLVDLKAQLIVARLSRIGEVRSTHPELEQLSEKNSLQTFEVRVETTEAPDVLRTAIDVEGVEAIWFGDEQSSDVPDEEKTGQQEAVASQATALPDDAELQGELTQHETSDDDLAAPLTADSPGGAPPQDSSGREEKSTESTTDSRQPFETPGRHAGERASAKVSETMRVEVDRLDNLMNLAGELVVNRARFVQISEQIRPELRRASMLNRIRDFGDSLRRTIESIEPLANQGEAWSAELQQLRAGLELMDEQTEIWNDGRHSIGQLSEAIDQLSRVSQSLQSGVLDTRMVPVGPLFSRFKRVVRDLSRARGKKVLLVIQGEKTELDKRMVDELGDPLVHLVRNSIDHGLESPDLRNRRGKSEDGTIFLEASHSGNNVCIVVRDDGGGIDVRKVKAKLIDNQILPESAVEQLSDEQALDYIWHPGFSTAAAVTDVSGRGVGMDVVRTRIKQMNGTVEAESTAEQGTTFTIRLPLTVAIINSLLVRLRNIVFSLPIDDVREIVSVSKRDIVSVHGRQTFDVRDQFIPLVTIEDVFQWHDIDYHRDARQNARPIDSSSDAVEVVILQAGGRTLGLRVDELLGSQDIVVKSLADNFIDIWGLSGASILGDGSVSLMLDAGAVIERAAASVRTSVSKEVAN